MVKGIDSEEDFELKVRQHVERLRQHTCQAIESEVARKRIAWVKDNYQAADNHVRLSPRTAFELLFFDYMGLPENDLPVLSESATEIVWLSRNRCATLEATQKLGLDTRVICRAAYEKSTQAFLSQLDPQLRFLRDYGEIRPYAKHCKEMIIRVDFEEMMKIAIAEAKASRRDGNKGYGAVVVLGRQILAQAHDTAITERDPSLHAEVNAIRQAVRAVGDSNLSGAILFSTCEPCPMCSSLAVWANLTTIVYGASIEKTARLGRSRILVGSREIIKKSPVMIEVIGDVLKAECLSLYV
jgi:tRNA(Arg) A34 adenosine deaminase TadA